MNATRFAAVATAVLSLVSCQGPSDGNFALQAESPIAGSGLPGDKLRIADGAFISGMGVANVLPLFTSTTTLGTSPLRADGSNILLGATQRLNKFGSGMTIGNATGGAALDMIGSVGDLGSSVGAIAFQNVGSTRPDKVIAQITATTTPIGGIFSATEGSLAFGTTDSMGNYATRMYVASSGNVGIGTTAPITALEVIGDVSIRRALGGFYSSIRLERSGQDDRTLSFINESDKETGGWEFYAPKFKLPVLRVQNNGRVGIDTSMPTARLQINFDNVLNGDNHWNAFFFEERETVGLSGVLNAAIRVPFPHFYGGSDNDKLGYLDLIKTAGGNTILGTNSKDGSPLGFVGIGTSSPQSRLQVAGPGYIQIPVLADAPPPPPSDCDSPAEAGRMIIYQKDQNSPCLLYICSPHVGWVTK